MYRLFIAEDEETTRSGLCRLVDWSGMRLSVCGSAENGMEALARMEGLRPHVLLTDVKMPAMDGVELARQARERYPALRIVFLSGYDDTAYLRAAIHIGAADYLLKPVDMDELAACMRKLTDALDREDSAAFDEDLPDAPPDASPSVRMACQLMRERCAENLTIQSLADQVYLTPNYLSQLFRQETGMTVNGYLTLVRLGRAKALLARPDARLSDISEAVGWQNPSYFSKQFRRHTGLTPFEYRRHILPSPPPDPHPPTKP